MADELENLKAMICDVMDLVNSVVEGVAESNEAVKALREENQNLKAHIQSMVEMENLSDETIKPWEIRQALYNWSIGFKANGT